LLLASENPQRVKLVSAELTTNRGTGHESFKPTFEVIDSDVHKAGDIVQLVIIVNGTSKDVGEGRVKAMSVGLMGCDTDADFDALFPKGEPIENALNGVEVGDATLLGREALVLVSKGGPTATGDYYRECEWAIAE